MKRFVLFSSIALLSGMMFCSCGGNKSAEPSPVDQVIAINDQVVDMMKATPIDAQKLKEFDKQMTELVEKNADYKMSDQDMDRLTDSIVESFLVVFETMTHPSNIAWMTKSNQIRASKYRVKQALIQGGTLAVVNDLSLVDIYADFLN